MTPVTLHRGQNRAQCGESLTHRATQIVARVRRNPSVAGSLGDTPARLLIESRWISSPKELEVEAAPTRCLAHDFREHDRQ
jgi:hypothetical protein